MNLCFLPFFKRKKSNDFTIKSLETSYYQTNLEFKTIQLIQLIMHLYSNNVEMEFTMKY